MITKQIEYRKLVSDGNFNNEAYGITVELEPGDTEAKAVNYARETVDGWFDEKMELKQAGQTVDSLHWREMELLRSIKPLEGRVRKLKEFEDRVRARMGLNPYEDDDYIPF